MSERPEGLPSYTRPPVEEAAVAVQFEVIEGLTRDALREFWKSVRHEYPSVEWRPPTDMPLETATSPAQSIQVVLNTTDRARVWLVSESDDYLIQVQDNTFVQNWRHRESSYTRFEDIREQFVVNYERLCSFLREKSLPQPVIQQAEVTYINWLPLDAASKWIRFLENSSAWTGDRFVEPEDMHWVTRYRLPFDELHVTRLYAQLGTAIRVSGPPEKGIQFTVLVRTGFASLPSQEALLETIDRARINVVEAFDRFATDEARIAWGRK